ncbi:cytochrome P460 family protein [Ahrensia sp. R2A130]|uniref:cytochrome P460 family protein n=1 Tax=Ahrensia sp. R2A130 TaxID=744979 RepID=UPI0001E083E2|nr:cytochrome P460 family protein [Ahrensia sp. R2A130]EFL89225.1 putative lipoprotein [Ahrensia sp. R2A130]
MKHLIASATFALTMFAAPAAFAACTSDVAKDDLTGEQVTALYDCIKAELREGYASQGGENTKEYQSWKAAATRPATVGVHGKRFLMTYVNETGFAEYTKYSEERGPMPVGSILAKESFNVSKKNKVQKGPLFFMTKVAAGGEAEPFGNWVYGVFNPKGKVQKISQKFCHDCHGNYDEQDFMGYPDEDVRIEASN